MMPKDLSVIIVSWNTKSLLQGCLQSLYQSLPGINFEVFVVDNASSDDSPDMVVSTFPDVQLIANRENAGYAAANNQAARLSNGRYLLFLNPDTLVLDNSLQKMLAYLDRNPEIGVLGPRLIYPDHSLQRSCWPNYPGLGMSFSDAFFLWKINRLPSWITNEYQPGDLEYTHTVAHLLGACILIRREAWDRAGPFDEQYFMYFEETELCYKMMKAGWQVLYYPEVEIIHFGQSSSRQIPDRILSHYYLSFYNFCRRVKQYSSIKLFLLKIFMIFGVFVRLGLWKQRERRAADQSYSNHSKKMILGYKKALKMILPLE